MVQHNAGVTEASPTAPPVVVDLGNSSPGKGVSSSAKASGGTGSAWAEGETSKAGGVDVRETPAKAAVSAELAAEASIEETIGKGVGPSPSEGKNHIP